MRYSFKYPQKKILLITFGAILFIGIGYFTFEYIKTQNELKTMEGYDYIKAIKEKNELIDKIGRHTILPQDEEPSIATVTDSYSLKDNKFYANSKNGDKVLVYANAQRAVLYRPSEDKVVEVANIASNDSPITSGERMIIDNKGTLESSESATEQVQSEPAKIAIHNGTLTNGLAKRVSDYLTAEFSDEKIEIEELTNANELFDETILVDVTKKYTSLKKELLEKLEAKEQNVPEAQDIPNVDVLIIIGKDFSPTNVF